MRVVLTILSMLLMISAPSISLAEDFWVDDFLGTPGQRVLDWGDESRDLGNDAYIKYSHSKSYAYITGTAGNLWGKVISPTLNVDVSLYPLIELSIAGITTNKTWKVGLQTGAGFTTYTDLNGSSNQTGVFTIDYAAIMGWASGNHTFKIQVTLEGEPGSYVLLDSIRIFNQVTPTITPTPTYTPDIPTEIEFYYEEFDGIAGEDVGGWTCNNVELKYSPVLSKANVIKKIEGASGSVEKTISDVPSADYPWLEIRVSGKSYWKEKWSLRINGESMAPYGLDVGHYIINYHRFLGLSNGPSDVTITIIKYGLAYSTLELDAIRIFAKNEPTPTPTMVVDFYNNHWSDNFEGQYNYPVSGWLDDRKVSGTGCEFTYLSGSAGAKLKHDDGMYTAHIISPVIEADVAQFPIIEIVTSGNSNPYGGHIAYCIENMESPYEILRVNNSYLVGENSYNYANRMGWATGVHKFRIRIYSCYQRNLEVYSCRIRSNTPTTPTVTPTQSYSRTYCWQDDFDGEYSVQATSWRDERQDINFNAKVSYSSYGSYAVVTRTSDDIWGKVWSPEQTVNVDVYPYLEFKIADIDIGPTWKMGVQEIGGSWQYVDLVDSSMAVGAQTVDYKSKTGWTGEKTFAVQVVVEGSAGEYIELDSMGLFGYPTYTSTITPSASPTITVTMTTTPTPSATATTTPTLTPTPFTASQEAEYYSSNTHTRGKYVVGDLLYLVTDDQNFRIYNIINPGMPQLLGSIQTPGNASDLFVSGKLAYIADGRNGVILVNVSDPANPFIVSNFKTESESTTVQVQGLFMYIADKSGVLKIVDISDPEHPVAMGSLQLNGADWDISIKDSMAYMVNGKGEMMIVDIQHPADPVKKGETSTRGPAKGIAVHEHYAYVADGNNGLVVYDVSIPDDIHAVKAISVPEEAVDVFVESGKAYVVGRSGFIYPLDVSDIKPQLSLEEGGYATPNPFLPGLGQKAYLNFTLNNPNDSFVIRIMNLRGRIVRILHHTREWDGRNQQGNLCNGGVYIYQIEAEGKRVSGKVVLIK